MGRRPGGAVAGTCCYWLALGKAGWCKAHVQQRHPVPALATTPSLVAACRLPPGILSVELSCIRDTLPPALAQLCGLQRLAVRRSVVSEGVLLTEYECLSRLTGAAEGWQKGGFCTGRGSSGWAGPACVRGPETYTAVDACSERVPAADPFTSLLLQHLRLWPWSSRRRRRGYPRQTCCTSHASATCPSPATTARECRQLVMTSLPDAACCSMCQARRQCRSVPLTTASTTPPGPPPPPTHPPIHPPPPTHPPTTTTTPPPHTQALAAARQRRGLQHHAGTHGWLAHFTGSVGVWP